MPSEEIWKVERPFCLGVVTDIDCSSCPGR